MNEDEIKVLIDTEIRHTLKVDFKIRAIIELLNIQQGKQAVIQRVYKIFETNAIGVENYNIKRKSPDGKTNVWGAKVIYADKLNIESLHNYVPCCTLSNKSGIIQSKLTVACDDKDSENGIFAITIDAATIKMKYITATFVADIDIIPIISNNLTKSYILVNAEAIAETLSAYSTKLAMLFGDMVEEIGKTKHKEFKNEIITCNLSRTKTGKYAAKVKKEINQKYADNTRVKSIFNTLERGYIML